MFVSPVRSSIKMSSDTWSTSTSLPEVCRFAEKHAGVIDFASDALDFAAAIRAAVSRDSPAAVERRLEVARRYDWSAMMERLSDWMEALLTAR